MSDQPKEGSGRQYDDPNREALGLDPAWVEGTGGGSTPAEPEPDGGLEQKTKAQLLEQAAAQGVDANESMTKAEIIAALEAG